jgi:hypothetical protein
MFYEIYASAAVRLFSTSELTALLEKSRRNNTSLGLSGMLLYKDGNFMQVLEGEESAVRQLMTKIKGDPRHKGVIELLQGESEERQFPDWSMGFRDLSTTAVHGTEGYSEFLNTQLTGAEFLTEPTRAQRLLLTFKRTM